jgi:TetR/AcrR family transcriptional repressor of lmrAB and yxaGH operons
MASGSDVRARMISAGQDLLSERGYRVTMLEVIERADAPRGSIYYHFPRGKLELAIEVATKVGRELDEFITHISRKIPEPVAFLQKLVDHHRKRLVSSGYDLGCPLMGIITSGDVESPELETAIREAFGTWTTAIARELGEKGFPPAKADRLASLLVSSIEGAIVVARAKQSPQPLLDVSRSIPALVAGALAADAD